MAEVTKVGTPTLSSVLPQQGDQLQCIAAEAIGACDVCYISGVAGNGQPLASLADGSAADALARARGVSAHAAVAGAAVTLYRQARFEYGATLVTTHGANAPVYLSATAGGIADAATTGGTTAIGYVVDQTRIQFNFQP
jgi:hypothetical protein